MDQTKKSDLTQGNILHLYAHIGVPASLGFIFNTFYNITDTWYGGQISSSALAGLSLSFPAFFSILALGMGIGTASVVLISNAIGAKKNKDVVLYFTQSLLLAAILSIVLFSFRNLYVVPLFKLMGASGESLDMAAGYMKTILSGVPFFILNNTLNSMLNARGDTKSYRNVLIAGFFINLVLDPLFLYGFWIIPPMGISGIALATVLVQVMAFFYLLRQISKIEIDENRRIFTMIRQNVKQFFIPNKKIIKEILQQAFPAILNSMSVAIGMYVINYFLNTYSNADAIAAYGVGIRIEQVFLLPAMGISVSLLSIVGQNYGAKKIDRIKKAFKFGLIIGGVSFLVSAIILLPFAQQLASLFSKDQIIIDYTIFYLRLEVLAYYCYILLPACNSVLQAIKKPKFVMWIGFSRQLLLPAIVFYVLSAVFGLKARGIFVGIAAINWMAAIVALLYTIQSLRNLTEEPERTSP